MGEEKSQTQQIFVQVGEHTFTATLFINNTTTELLTRMPITLDMQELHGNEKYYFFSEALPTNSERAGSIQTGDIMLYGSDCLVLFYKDFATFYSYTKLGVLNNPEGLADALGTGAVTVTLDLIIEQE